MQSSTEDAAGMTNKVRYCFADVDSGINGRSTGALHFNT